MTNNKPNSAVSGGSEITEQQQAAIRLLCSVPRMSYEQIAMRLGIGISTLRSWRKDSPLFRGRLLEAEEELDQIAKSELTPDPAIRLLKKIIDHGLTSDAPGMVHVNACGQWLDRCEQRQARRRSAFDEAEAREHFEKTEREIERRDRGFVSSASRPRKPAADFFNTA